LKVGTPPQTFKVLLDFSWSSEYYEEASGKQDLLQEGLFLPSVQCTSSLCRPSDTHPGPHQGPHLFNESASETYIPSDKRSSVFYAWTAFDGTLGADVANLAGITVTHQEFLDATDVYAPSYISFYQYYDGVLGLAPFEPSNTPDLATYPSIFKSIVRERLIAHNVFTLELPQGERFVKDGRTPGSLHFGQPRLSSSAENVITLSLSEISTSEQNWYASGSHFDWDNGKLEMSIGPHYPVHMDLGSPSILLARPLATLINQQISLPDAGNENVVDCDTYRELPSLVLSFDGGARLEIGPDDYVFERTFKNGTRRACLSMFDDTDNNPGISIGATVLERYVTGWDLDAKEIRCKLYFYSDPNGSTFTN
jgi:Eukaryotic aspartyl protease